MLRLVLRSEICIPPYKKKKSAVSRYHLSYVCPMCAYISYIRTHICTYIYHIKNRTGDSGLTKKKICRQPAITCPMCVYVCVCVHIYII